RRRCRRRLERSQVVATFNRNATRLGSPGYPTEGRGTHGTPLLRALRGSVPGSCPGAWSVRRRGRQEQGHTGPATCDQRLPRQPAAAVGVEREDLRRAAADSRRGGADRERGWGGVPRHLDQV